MRVLIAEDEWLTATVLRSVVESHGFEVVGTVCTGAEAVNVCTAEHPDLVLMDIQMPGMNGLEATRTLMCASPTCVVIVTGRGQLRQAAEEAGAMDYVMKPLLSDRIPELVQAARERFEHFLTVRSEVAGPEEALDTWLLVQRAVARQVAGDGMSENGVFGLLRREAKERGISLRALAEEKLQNGAGPRE